MKLEVRKQGDDLILRIPENAIAELGWQSGDCLVAKVDAKGLSLVRSQTKQERTGAIAEKILEEYRETFEALAKT